MEDPIAAWESEGGFAARFAEITWRPAQKNSPGRRSRRRTQVAQKRLPGPSINPNFSLNDGNKEQSHLKSLGSAIAQSRQ